MSEPAQPRPPAQHRPDIGDAVPDIALTMPDGATVRPSDYRGRPLVLFFYPRDNTPGCTGEAKDFSQSAPAFAEAGVALLGISKDPPASHGRFIARHGLTVPLASDAETGGLADALGIWVEKSMYGKRFMGMERTTLLVDRDGRISRAWRKVKVKGHAEAVLAAATAL